MDWYIMAFAVMFAFFLLPTMGQSILREKEQGSLRRLLAAPLPRSAIIAGLILTYTLIVFLQVLFLFGVGKLVFNISLGPSLLGLFLICMVFAAAGQQVFQSALAAMLDLEFDRQHPAFFGQLLPNGMNPQDLFEGVHCQKIQTTVDQFPPVLRFGRHRRHDPVVVEFDGHLRDVATNDFALLGRPENRSFFFRRREQGNCGFRSVLLEERFEFSAALQQGTDFVGADKKRMHQRILVPGFG
jgi:hypothetical protein